MVIKSHWWGEKSFKSTVSAMIQIHFLQILFCVSLLLMSRSNAWLYIMFFGWILCSGLQDISSVHYRDKVTRNCSVVQTKKYCLGFQYKPGKVLSVFKWIKHKDMCLYCKDVLNVFFYFPQTFSSFYFNQRCLYFSNKPCLAICALPMSIEVSLNCFLCRLIKTAITSDYHYVPGAIRLIRTRKNSSNTISGIHMYLAFSW